MPLNSHRLVRGTRIGQLLLIAALLLLLARRNEPLAHVLTLGWSVLVAWSIYVFSAKSRDYREGDYLSLLGAGFLAICLLDACHALTHEGMSLIAGAGPHESAQIWLAARLAEAVTLGGAALLAHRRRIGPWAPILAATLAFALLALILGADLLPAGVTPETACTPPARMLRAVITLLLAAGIVTTWLRREHIGPRIAMTVISAMVLMIVSELTIAMSAAPTHILLQVSHLLRIFAYYLVYRAVVIAGLHDPVDQLRRSRAMVRAALEATIDGMMVADRRGEVIASNTKFDQLQQVLSKDEQDHDGTDGEEHRRETGADRLNAIRTRARQHPDRVTDDVITLHNGATIEVFSGPFDVDGQLQGRVWCLRDITDRRAAEAQAAETRRELMHAARVSMMGQLTASLAHEIHQPLAAILNNAHAGLRFMGQPDTDLNEVRDILQDIADDDQRAVDIIRNIRAMLRKESTAPETLDLRDIVTDVFRMVRSELDSKQVEAQLELCNSSCPVDADRVQLQQVVLNLAINAMDAMRETPVPMRILAVTMPPPADSVCRIDFHDHGCGMSDDSLARIFEPFFTTKHDGMGMGLVLCQSIIDAHGGKLWATRNADCGMTFSVELPLALQP